MPWFMGVPPLEFEWGFSTNLAYSAQFGCQQGWTAAVRKQFLLDLRKRLSYSLVACHAGKSPTRISAFLTKREQTSGRPDLQAAPGTGRRPGRR